MKSIKLLLLAIIVLISSLAQSATTNYLLNSGFESGLTDWDTTGGAAIRTGGPDPYEGQNYLYGSSTPLFTASQTFDINDIGFTSSDIDSGLATVEFGGWQAGWETQTDNGTISIVFYDGAMGALGSISLDSFYSNMTWVELSGSGDVLFGTQFIEYLFTGRRTGGSNNDAYLDSAYLSTSVSAVPIPTGVFLFGPALLGFLGFRRKMQG